MGDSASLGLLPTYGCAVRVGLSDRGRVVGELARVQPSVARVAANKRTMDERLAMLSILTSSPESGSRETSPGDVREPSGQSGSDDLPASSSSDSEGLGSRYCPASCPDIRL